MASQALLNATAACQMGQQELLQSAHEWTAVPAVITIYVAMVFFMLIGGLLVAKESKKYWGIFAFVAIAGAVFTTFVVNTPNIVQSIAQYFVSG